MKVRGCRRLGPRGATDRVASLPDYLMRLVEVYLHGGDMADHCRAGLPETIFSPLGRATGWLAIHSRAESDRLRPRPRMRCCARATLTDTPRGPARPCMSRRRLERLWLITFPSRSLPAARAPDRSFVARRARTRHGQAMKRGRSPPSSPFLRTDHRAGAARAAAAAHGVDTRTTMAAAKSSRRVMSRPVRTLVARLGVTATTACPRPPHRFWGRRIVPGDAARRLLKGANA